MIATIQRCMQKCLEVCPGAAQFKVLPNILGSTRTLPSKATGVQPYLVTFKQCPEIPLSRALHKQVFGAPWMEWLLGSGFPDGHLDGQRELIDATSLSQYVVEKGGIFEDIG